MGFFNIPDKPLFNTTQVTRTEQTQPVINDHLNAYMQTLLENDQHCKNTEEDHYTEVLNSIERINTELSKKLDGEGTVVDYDEAINMQETGKVPDCTIIRRLYLNFLAGCRAIARAITGGRDGEGTGGVTTADNASPTTMATNIKDMALKNYNDGLNAATGTTPSVSHVWNPENPAAGSDASLQAKVLAEGYVAIGTVLASTAAIVNGTALAVTGGTGNEILDIPLGVYKKIKVDRTAAYQKGVNDTKDSAPTIAHIWNPANPVAGATASLQAKSSTAGYVNANEVLANTDAGTNSAALAVTSGTGVETLDIIPGVYNKIKIDRTNAYTAGQNNVKATAPTYTSSFSSSTAGADSNFVVKTATAGYTGANVTSLTKAAETNSTAIATGATRNTAEVVKIAPGIYNNIKINNAATYDAGVASVKVARKLTLTASQTGSNVDITDNWYTTCDASAVYNAGISYADGRVNTSSNSYKACNIASIVSLYNGANEQRADGSSSSRPAGGTINTYTFTKAYKYIALVYDGGGYFTMSAGTLVGDIITTAAPGGLVGGHTVLYKDVPANAVATLKYDASAWSYYENYSRWAFHWSAAIAHLKTQGE